MVNLRIEEDLFIKHYGIHWEAYIDNGLHLFCIAKGTIANVIIIDTISTPYKFRRRGYATRLMNVVKDHFQKELFPFAVADTECAQKFWNSLKINENEGE